MEVIGELSGLAFGSKHGNHIAFMFICRSVDGWLKVIRLESGTASFTLWASRYNKQHYLYRTTNACKMNRVAHLT